MSENTKDKKTLAECFDEMKDPRKNDVDHKFIDIMIITVLAVLCGANGFNEIELFGKSKEKWLRTFLALTEGIPSHDTFNRVLSLINPQEFHNCFMEWVTTLREKISREIVAIDGKTVRRTREKSSGKKPIHVVSAWANANKLVLGQIKVDEKSNEITAIPELLNLLDVEGCIITIDAMGTQTDIAKTIIDSGAEYVLALKENQPTLHDDVKLYFDEEIITESKKTLEEKGVYYKTLEKDHGRIEKREYYMVKDISWLDEIHKNKWVKLSAIGMIISERTINDETSTYTRLHIMSDIKDVKEYANAIRNHWGIENELHWCLDVGFREDESRARKDNSAENLNIIRHWATNLLKHEKSVKQGIQAKRLKCGWDEKYLLKVLKVGFDL